MQSELDCKKDRLDALEKDLNTSVHMHKTLEDTFNQQRHHWEAKVGWCSVPLALSYISLAAC